MGFLGGLMLAIICFDIIPESFEDNNTYLATIGIFIGLFTAILLDSIISHHSFESSNSKKQRYFKVAFFMSIGIHNIPAGIALGSLLNISYTQGIQLAIALLHGIPEGLTLGIYLKESNSKILPESTGLWRSRLSAIGTVLGIIVGKLFVLIIH